MDWLGSFYKVNFNACRPTRHYFVSMASVNSEIQMGVKTVGIGMIGALALGASVDVASAATISWSGAINISNPGSNPTTDIDTSGQYVNAIYAGPSTSTVSDDGVTFYGGKFDETDSPYHGDGIYSQNTLTTDPIVATGNFAGGQGGDYHVGGPGVTDTTYNTVLSYLAFNGNGNPGTSSDPYLTFSLNGLHQGDEYAVQIFVYQPSGGGNGANILGGPDLSSSGQYAIGTFVADGTGSQTFTLDNPSGATIFDAVQLRDLSVPEPASVGLAVLGMSGVLMRRRRAVNL
jgi:hypothetical protein